MRDQTRAPRTYELLTILHPEVVEDEIPAALDRVAGLVAAQGGTVQETLRDSPWGRRRLAYPIRFGGRDLRDGYYTVFHVELAPGQIDDLERELKLNTQVIRYLVTSWEPKPLDPKEPLSDDDCSYLYEDVLDACIGHQGSCRSVLADLPSANARPVKAMDTNYAAFPERKCSLCHMSRSPSA